MNSFSTFYLNISYPQTFILFIINGQESRNFNKEHENGLHEKVERHVLKHDYIIDLMRNIYIICLLQL